MRQPVTKKELREAARRRKPMSERRFRGLMRRKLGARWSAADICEVMLELERARAVEGR